MTDTLDSVWEEIVRFNDEHFPGWRLERVDLKAADMVGGAGGGYNAAQHLLGRGPKLHGPDKKAKAIEETFDTVVYAVLFLESVGVDRAAFIEVAKRKLVVLYARMAAKSYSAENP